MLRVNGLRATAGGFALSDVTLELSAGEYGVLLGSTGSGKTVLIETLCGLRATQAGSISLADKDGEIEVSDLEPRDRAIGYVPQDYVLFPTKTVASNVTLGLRARGIGHAQAISMIDPIIEMLGIGHLLGRWPATLSGGEQQRVALARALAIKPRLLLLDEPVSALDESTRENVCMELKRIQRETGTTTLHVCHNLEEARIVADRLAVMRQGSVIQIGTPDEVFARPRDAELANFLRVGSVVAGTAQPDGEGCRVTVAGGVLTSSEGAAGPVQCVIRADEVSLIESQPVGAGQNLLEAEVERVSPRGLFTRIDSRIAPGISVIAYVPRTAGAPDPGGQVWLSFPPSAVHILKE